MCHVDRSDKPGSARATRTVEPVSQRSVARRTRVGERTTGDSGPERRGGDVAGRRVRRIPVRILVVTLLRLTRLHPRLRRQRLAGGRIADESFLVARQIALAIGPALVTLHV